MDKIDNKHLADNSRMARTNRIRGLRLKQGMSLNALAKATGLSKSVVSEIETHKKNIRPSESEKIAKVLGVQPNDLYKED